MKVLQWLTLVLLAVAIAAAVLGWKSAQQLRSELEAVRAENQVAQAQSQAAAEAQSKRTEAELQRLRAQAQEVPKLRGEVSQLRGTAKETETLRTENQQLRTALRTAATTTPATPPPPVPADQFPRENWAFSGYATPEAALVSAIWAMREGKPQTYLESLSPEEQQRLAKTWQNKSEAEIVAKHQQDVASISNIRILERQAVSDNEVVMSVVIEGTTRAEKVLMKRAGNDWKFGGFIRNPTP